MFWVVSASEQVFTIVEEVVVRPMYMVTSWNPRKSVVLTVTRPLLLNYAFVHWERWMEVIELLEPRGRRIRRMMVDGKPLPLSGIEVEDIEARALAGEWDVDCTHRPKPSLLQRVQGVGVGGEVKIDLAGVSISGIVVSSGAKKVEINYPGSSMRIVVS